MNLTTKCKFSASTLTINQIYQSLEKEIRNGLTPAEADILIDFQSDLLKIEKLITSIEQGGAHPETTHQIDYCRRRVLLFKRQISAIANTPCFLNKLPITEIEKQLSDIINHLIDLLTY